MVHVKILSYKSPQRYAVRRTVLAAHHALRQEFPDLEIDLTEVKDLFEMEKYTAVVIYPSLVINEKLVCVGRFPSKEEVARWLREAAE